MTELHFKCDEIFFVDGTYYERNFEFDYPIWKSSTTSSEIMIMINGFLEGVGESKKREQLLKLRYGKIAEKLLNDKNIVSVLLPLPFHFNRSLDITGQDQYAPISRLTRDGRYLYDGGFTQIIADVRQLIMEIKSYPSKFGLKESGSIKFHLLGYSIGGVAAIGAAEGLKENGTPYFDSLTVLLSAWNLDMIEPDAIVRTMGNFGLTTELWNGMLEQLNGIRGNVHPIFRKLIWDEGDPIDFESCTNRILFLNGLRDEIFTTSHTDRIRQQVLEMMDKCTFINLPTDHQALRASEEIAGYVSTFVCSGR